MRLLVSDTSPLVAFSAVDRLDILRIAAPDLRVPPAVYKEIVTEGTGWHEAAKIQGCLEQGEWPLVQPPLPCDTLNRFRLRLGAGESEALTLGLELGVTVIVDDSDARKMAARHSISVVGTLGLLGECKRRGLLFQLAPVIREMRKAGIRFGDTLVQNFLAEHGEQAAWEQGGSIEAAS